MLNTILSIPKCSEPSIFWIVFSIIIIIITGLVIIGCLIAGIYGIIDCDDDLSSCLWGVIIGGLFIWPPIFILVTTLEDNKNHPKWYEQEIVEVQYDHIYSLELESDIKGHFLLGNGYIGSTNYYYFYTKNSKDLFSLEKIKIESNVYLKESDTTPRVEERKDANSADIYIVIYVPVGTVVDYGYNPY